MGRPKIKRLLCLVSIMDAGGAETYMMKLLRKIDRTKYRIDFGVNENRKGVYDKEIKELGGKIYYIPPKSKDLFAFRRALRKVIKKNGYEYVLRITSNGLGLMDLKIAKKAGAKVTAARSSNSSDGGGKKTEFLNRMGRNLYAKYVDVKLAPSDLAGKYTFGEEAYMNGEVHILPNGLDYDEYSFSEEKRDELREYLNIPSDALAVGHIGRFVPQKNHSFLLEVFSEIKKKRPDAHLILTGTGADEEAMKKYAKTLKIDDCTHFLGVRPDVKKILSAMDLFVFPSFYEGMPNTVIEAQASGLPVVLSDTITKEADITGLLTYLPLGDRVFWAEKALEKVSEERKDTKEDFRKAGYDIEVACELLKKYIFQD
ncbi:MAG: glycosyltransferase family 1 protein [Clostridia bacterium]|nr:glycosyltransferase family 1 protein [Clostridia bacterium]